MSMSTGNNPPCERCGTETLHHSDHSGGWNECPDCRWMQGIRHTPGGTSGVLTGADPGITHIERYRLPSQQP